jgi:hypothetical protein
MAAAHQQYRCSPVGPFGDVPHYHVRLIARGSSARKLSPLTEIDTLSPLIIEAAHLQELAHLALSGTGTPLGD